MRIPYILFLSLAVLDLASAASLRPPQIDDAELYSEGKVREKRKGKDSTMMQRLEESGQARRVAREQVKSNEERKSLEPIGRSEEPPAAPPTAGLETETDTQAGRIKKASNLGPCGRTACGPLVSANGPSVADLVTMSGPEGLEMRSNVMMPPMGPMGRTYDLGFSGSSGGHGGGYGGGGYGGSYGGGAGYNALTSPSYGHSIFAQVPAPQPVHIEQIPYPPAQQHGSHSLIGLLKHPGLGGHEGEVNLNVNYQNLPHYEEYPDYHKLQDVYYVPQVTGFTEIRRPVIVKPQSYVPHSYEPSQPLICQPYKSYKEHKGEGSKAVNTSDHDHHARQMDDTPASMDSDETKIREHLKRVSDIKDEIIRLNDAASKIINQQERLARLQQEHMSGMGGEMRTASFPRQLVPPYMGVGGMGMMGGMGGMGSSYQTTHAGASQGSYNNHYPFPYSRANAANYPAQNEDIEFFVRMLNAAKQAGRMSNDYTPVNQQMDAQTAAGPTGQTGQKGQKENVFTDLVDGGKPKSAQKPEKPETNRPING